MRKMHGRATMGMLPVCLAMVCATASAQTENGSFPGVEARIHAIIEHDNLGDNAFLSGQLGMHLRVEPDGAGDLRGILLAAPDFAFASGFSYTIRHDSRSDKDEVRLDFLFRQCPDEARFVNDWQMPLEHLQLGDGSGSVTRFTPANGDSVAFTLIYQTLNGICEAAFSQQIAPRQRPETSPALPENPETPRLIAGAFARLMLGADLRRYTEVASALHLPLYRMGFRNTDKSAGNGLLLAENTSPGIDSEMFSYVIQDTGWQAAYPFAAEPEILGNRRVSIHIPVDIRSACITPKQISDALHGAGVRTSMSQPGRNVLGWQTRGSNTLTLLATRQGACIEAADFTQITDAAHALPETMIFRLPLRTPKIPGATDKALIARIAYRLRGEVGYTLNFIAQLPSTAQLADFERMDAWMTTLRKAFENAGMAAGTMEFHLYPPAAAGTPARVFLLVVRDSGRCRPATAAIPDPVLPSAAPCH